MHRYSANIIVPDLDLAGMEAAAHFDSQRPKQELARFRRTRSQNARRRLSRYF
jgi:hypothetical protein